jgi:predicted transposase YbfD/YdcC
VVYRLYRVEPVDDYGWSHLRQWIRIERELWRGEEKVEHGKRDWASSMPWNSLSAMQWLDILRRYWRCENDNHWTADVIWKEDRKRQPWSTDPEALYVASMLRMIALNLLSLVRRRLKLPGLTGRPPWKQVIKHVERTLMLAGYQLVPATH